MILAWRGTNTEPGSPVLLYRDPGSFFVGVCRFVTKVHCFSDEQLFDTGSIVFRCKSKNSASSCAWILRNSSFTFLFACSQLSFCKSFTLPIDEHRPGQTQPVLIYRGCKTCELYCPVLQRNVDYIVGICYYSSGARAVWSTHIIPSCLLRKEVVPWRQTSKPLWFTPRSSPRVFWSLRKPWRNWQGSKLCRASKAHNLRIMCLFFKRHDNNTEHGIIVFWEAGNWYWETQL